MMDVLWAGWRAAYMSEIQAGVDSDGCLFCELPAGSDESTHVLERGEAAYSVLNLYPYTSGHLMISPYRHIGTPAGLSADERREVWDLLARSQAAIDAVLSPHASRSR